MGALEAPIQLLWFNFRAVRRISLEDLPSA
jgi:hypothetical protein